MKMLDLKFGKFELFPDVVVGRICEGVHFNMQLNKILGDRIIEHYGEDHKIGYISIRKNSYSIDPMVHLHNTQYPSLCSIGIVETSIIGRSNVALESKFFKPGKLKSFLTSEQALIWTNNQILDSVSGMSPTYRFN